MISRLSEEGRTDNARYPEHASSPHTLLLACAEEHATPPRCKRTLREHALVLRTHGGELVTASGGPLSSALTSHPISRVILLGHTGCITGKQEARTRPARNTAAIHAWFRYAPAASALAERFAASELSMESFGAKLDTLVRLANIEACAELCSLRSCGALDLVGAVWDASHRRLELFDGRQFRLAELEEFRRLIAGGHTPGRDARPIRELSPAAAFAPPSVFPSGEYTGGMA